MIKKKRKSNKYIFTLKGINIDKIDEKYGIKIISNFNYSENVPNNATKLIDINLDKPVEMISFLDESKKLYQCNITMIDFTTGNQTNTLNYNCYWCHHPFTSYPIGCPIKYVSNKATKKYHSEITKDTYIIKENITSKKTNKIQNTTKYTPFNFFLFNETNLGYNLDIKEEQYFYTDGIFCSFNCCKAFIKDNKHNRLYNYSEILLTKLFNHIMKVENNSNDLENLKISPAPHWRLLQVYGGHLSINKFRENFNKVTYNFHGIINKDIFKPIGHLYEEKINF
jgi:hypothetical protein